MRVLHAVALAAFFATATGPLAGDSTIGAISILNPWTRATPTGARVGVGYFTLRNNGAADALIKVSSDAAGEAIMHETTSDNGVMRMRAVDALTLPPGASMAFKPGGHHVMFTDLKAPFKAGDTIKATLTFERAGSVTVAFAVYAAGAAAPLDAAPATPGMEGQ